MFNYECELCNKPFCTTDEQKNPVCNHCKEAYNINDDYIYGTGEYAKKKEPPAKVEKKKPNHLSKMVKLALCVAKNTQVNIMYAMLVSMNTT